MKALTNHPNHGEPLTEVTNNGEGQTHKKLGPVPKATGPCGAAGGAGITDPAQPPSPSRPPHSPAYHSWFSLFCAGQGWQRLFTCQSEGKAMV